MTSQTLGPWRLGLTVVEGPLTRIGTITIIGNEAYDTVTLTNYLLGPTRERYPRIRQDTGLPFIESDMFQRSGLGPSPVCSRRLSRRAG